MPTHELSKLHFLGSYVHYPSISHPRGVTPFTIAHAHKGTLMNFELVVVKKSQVSVCVLRGVKSDEMRVRGP